MIRDCWNPYSKRLEIEDTLKMRPWRKASIFPLDIAVSDRSTRMTTPLFTVMLKMKTTPEMVEQSCGKNVLNDIIEPLYHSVLPFL